MKENSNLPIHISFDVDALDPKYISSTGTRVDNGLHPHEVNSIIAEALRIDQLKSLDVVEFNPALGDPVKSMFHVRETFKEFFPQEFPVKL
jgi:arginase